MRTNSLLCLVIIIGLVFYSGISSASTSMGRGAVEKLNGVTFTHPESFVSLPHSESENMVFMYNKKYKLGLFVAVPSIPFKEDEIVGNLVETSISTFFPKEPHTYVWKPASDYKKISKFEIKGGKAQGYNKRQRVVVLYRHLVIEKKDIFVGYMAEFERGKEAEEMFNVSLGGESMPGCNASVKVISSITGEKIEETVSPCELIAIRPSSNP